MAKQETFSSRLGMMLAMLGMAVGTGNIWRFPRIAAKNGGGEFLVAWIVFLLLWSIPLVLVEFGLGRKTRSGPIRTFIEVLGPRWAWMGAFCVLVTSAISFYYSVVAGWTLRYITASLTGEISGDTPGVFWNSFTESYEPVVMHVVMIGAAVFVVARGVRAIERVGFFLMPAMIVLVVILTIRAVMLPGAGDGLAYLFTVDWENLAQPRIWIEALVQNAWDTGAGWGLVLCYAVYLRRDEDTALNAFLLPAANNVISLLAAIMVFCTVFSAVPQLIDEAASNPRVLQGLGTLDEAVAAGRTFSPELLQETVFSEGNTGITFIWMPQLFNTLAFGRFFMLLFFSALGFAAFTSLVAMVEVFTRALVDAGIERTKAIRIVGITSLLLGLPSALWMQALDNQDWVWSVALMLSGLFFSIAVVAHGVKRFRDEHLNHEHSDIRVGRWWDGVIAVVVPLEAVFLLGWFLYQSRLDDPVGWLRPFDSGNVFNVGTVLFQLGIACAVLIALNGWIVKKTAAAQGFGTEADASQTEPPP